MAEKNNNRQNPTIFQRLQSVLGGGTQSATRRTVMASSGNRYNVQTNPNEVIAVADSEAQRDRDIMQMRQQRLLAKQWIKAQNDISAKQLQNTNELRFMYRDCDLMDNTPEIATALDIYAEESCTPHDDGQLIRVTADSERVKGVLQDLFVNRLAVNTTLPMITRGMCKYGNQFYLLNLSDKEGVLGWSQLPVYEIERYDNGMACPYNFVSRTTSLSAVDENQPDDTKFVWVGQPNENCLGYRNWQIAHFRMLYDSSMLPYGVSILNKARRHFRMLSMMEDMMLLYRLDRSVERRVFNIDVGNIDEQDVPAYIEEIANNFKRTPIVDPLTGQIDTRKRLLNIGEDFFIPRRPGDSSSKIETLPAGQNLTAMDDIKYIQNKIFTALRVPRAFLNFEETQGEGKNLSLLDVRFTRTVNRVQQMLLMELNKIAIIHLMLLGLTDELTQFKLSMHNPSTQAEMLEIENWSKKITTAKDAVSDPGNGLPLVSNTFAMKKFLNLSNKEIQQILEEQRLEKALASELEKTASIIKRTHIFDPVDNVYGEPGAEYPEGNPDEEGGVDGGAPVGGGGLPIGDSDFNFGDEGGEEGAESEISMQDAANEESQETNDEGNENLTMGESLLRKARAVHLKKTAPTELKNRTSHINKIIEELSNRYEDTENQANRTVSKIKVDKPKPSKIIGNFMINEGLGEIVGKIDDIISNDPLQDFEEVTD